MAIRKRKWTSGGKSREAWVVDYVDQHGKRRLKTFGTKREADAWAVSARHEVQQGIHTASSSSKTVTEAWEFWLSHCEANGLEFGTILQRRQHLKLHVAPRIGKDKLAALTAPRINHFLRESREAGLSLSMRRKVLTNLKTMLTFAQGEGYVAQNVARGIRLANDDRAEEGPIRAGVNFPTRAELKLLMEKAPARWRPFLITAIFTGMRASELRGLTWSDVDVDVGMIHVRQRADAWKKIRPPEVQGREAGHPVAPTGCEHLAPMAGLLPQWRGKPRLPQRARKR